MSITSILGSARLALQAQQVAMETASHNIANANVDGYTRQRVDLEPNLPMYTAQGAIGTGVLVKNITRVRDTMLDTNYRTQSAQASGYGMRRDLLTEVSNVFGEPSDSGLSATLDQFWSAWGDLANSPTSTAAKSVVQQRGAEIASTLNRFSTNLDTIADQTRSEIDSELNSVNRYTSQIANLNRQIVAAEAGGKSANDLRDARDSAVDALNDIVPVRVIEQSNGSATVYVGGTSIVDGTDAKTLSTQTIGGTLQLMIGGQSVPVNNPGGTLGASLNVLNTDLPAAKGQLDDMAAAIVTTVNTIHRTGWTQAGDALGGANWDPTTPPTGSNVDFFDPTHTTAANISLSTAVASDASYIAAGDVQNGTGNNNVANALAGLRDDTSSILKYGSTTQTTSVGEYYRDLVTRLGVDTNDADASATVFETMAQQASIQRQSVSGVSTDDELVELTKRQQAYSAAARVITVASDMSQTLLDLVH